MATDTLSVAWLRGVFRHDARASQAAFRDYVSCLDDVYADERASGVPPPVHESSHGKCSHTPAPHRLSGCATHSKAMALSLPIHKLVWLCWSRASAARQASAQLRCERPSRGRQGCASRRPASTGWLMGYGGAPPVSDRRRSGAGVRAARRCLSPSACC